MGSFSGEMWSVEAAQTPMLTAAHLNELAEWSEVEVLDAEEKTTAKGGKYAHITFRLTESKLTLRMNYFRAVDILPFLKIMGLTKLKDSSQVVGKKLCLKFREEVKEGKAYVRIDQYAGRQPEATGAQQTIDEVPF